VTRVLITNDDGIDAPGIRRLAAAVVEAGLDVVVAAPSTEASGSSAAITALEKEGRVLTEERELDGLTGVTAYGVSAAPGFIALIATRGAFGPPPDMVLSGVNRGANTGRAVLHSGTVGAAFTALAAGTPAMAVSLDIGIHPAGRPHWDTAAELACRLLPLLSADFVVNLNVPDLPPNQVRGVRQARLATFGTVQTNIAEVGEGFVRIAVEEVGARLEPGTDAALLADGYASVTALRLPCEVTPEPLDLDRVLRPAPTP
jgi:5'-nucleotidase